jgi:amidophosphoribosyltransferase
VFGVHGHPEASHITYLGLYALQHRGQESAGIVSTAGVGREHHVHRAMGLVADIFSETSFATPSPSTPPPTAARWRSPTTATS